MVSEKGEGLTGHHATHTLAIFDEARGADEMVYDRMTTWAKSLLVIGKPYPCENCFERAMPASLLKLRQRQEWHPFTSRGPQRYRVGPRGEGASQLLRSM
jgi:hypothetical protein